MAVAVVPVLLPGVGSALDSLPEAMGSGTRFCAPVQFVLTWLFMRRHSLVHWAEGFSPIQAGL